MSGRAFNIVSLFPLEILAKEGLTWVTIYLTGAFRIMNGLAVLDFRESVPSDFGCYF